jgi:hypothetical protein
MIGTGLRTHIPNTCKHRAHTKHAHASKPTPNRQVSAEEAARITAGAIPALLASRRLVLVLDLDHTLLNSVREGDVSEDERPMLLEVLARQRAAAEAAAAGGAAAVPPSADTAAAASAAAAAADGAGSGEGGEAAAGEAEGAGLPSNLGHWSPPLLYHLAHCRLWTKLRPRIREFLRVRLRSTPLLVSHVDQDLSCHTSQ